LSQERIDAMEKARDKRLTMAGCDKLKMKSKSDTWGHTLVERQRRRQDTGVPVLQKVVELKKKKNLEMVKGNSFATLQFDKLNEIALDANLKFVNSSEEAKFIIDNMIEVEQKCYNNFVEGNFEICLPLSLYIESETPDISDNKTDDTGLENTLVQSVKDNDTSPSWTVVVRKGKNRSRSEKILDHDRRSLEY
jgi:hypothetical protein